MPSSPWRPEQEGLRTHCLAWRGLSVCHSFTVLIGECFDRHLHSPYRGSASPKALSREVVGCDKSKARPEWK